MPEVKNKKRKLDPKKNETKTKRPKKDEVLLQTSSSAHGISSVLKVSYFTLKQNFHISVIFFKSFFELLQHCNILDYCNIVKGNWQKKEER